MATLTVRKNFNFDKNLVEYVGKVIKKKDITFTKLITEYFQAIVKEPSLIDEVHKKAKQRTGSFIGMLDGKIGDTNFKDMKSQYHENFS